MHPEKENHDERLSQVASSFEQRRYFVIRRIISTSVAGALCSYVRRQVDSGRLRADVDVPLSWAAYADHNFEKLLVKLKPLVEQATGLALYPVYSYCRLYSRGAELSRHCDRDACEISLSINLGQDPPNPWPLWIRHLSDPHAALLSPGDALLYRGIECEHWREPFLGNHAAQVFLHYVDRNGPYAIWKFDKRNALNLLHKDDMALI